MAKKLAEYFSEFFSYHLQERRTLFVKDGWTLHLGMILTLPGKFGPNSIFFPKKANILSKDKVKRYEIIIPLVSVGAFASDPNEYYQLIYEALKIFFTSISKKNSLEFIDYLWGEVDLDYLASLKYPAALEEQKYLGDESYRL